MATIRNISSSIISTTQLAMFEEQDTAAVKIQYWWRKKLKADEKIAIKAMSIGKWNGFEKISLQNDELIQKLRKLKKEKALEITRYETILNRPAREVKRYMKGGLNLKKKSPELDEYDIAEKHEKLRREHAAKIIQKFFRKLYLEKMKKKYQTQITNIKLKRKLHLLDEIRIRLEQRRVIRTDTLENLKASIANHNKDLEKDAKKMALREILIREQKRDQHLFLDILPKLDEYEAIRSLSQTPSSSTVRAHRRHAEELGKIEDIMCAKI